jgi:hypothetical protein
VTRASASTLGEFRMPPVARSFAEAAEASGAPIERLYGVADGTVRVRFADSRIERALAPALTHLAAPESRPDLNVDVWDSSCGASRPEIDGLVPATGTDDLRNHHAPGASYHFDDGTLQGLYQPGPDILSAISGEGTHAWFWVADAARLPYWDRAAPLRHILSWWLSGRGVLQVHGGAVGTPSGGILLVGRGGSGKSTTTLATLLDPRLLYAGDDYVALSTLGEPWVHSLYCSAKVDPDNLARVPHVRAMVANADRLDAEKAVAYVGDSYATRLTRGFPLAAIVLPKITPTGPRVVATSPAEALKALAPSTVLQRRPPRPAELAHLRRLTEAVPAFALDLGPRPAEVPRVIVDLLAELRGRKSA